MPEIVSATRSVPPVVGDADAVGKGVVGRDASELPLAGKEVDVARPPVPPHAAVWVGEVEVPLGVEDEVVAAAERGFLEDALRRPRDEVNALHPAGIVAAPRCW